MSHQFKPGDLALVVGTVSAHEVIGRTVELIEHLGCGKVIWLDKNLLCENTVGGPVWRVRLLDGPYTDNLGNYTDHGACPEKFLMPLIGDCTTEQHKAKEVEPCA